MESWIWINRCIVVVCYQIVFVGGYFWEKINSFFCVFKFSFIFAPALGEVAEWSIAAVLKTVVLRGTRGSNPCLSATNAENQQIAKQTPSFAPKNVKSGVFVLFKIIQPLHNKRVAILKESDEKRLIFIYPFSLIFQDFTSSWKYLLLYSNVRSGL